MGDIFEILKEKLTADRYGILRVGWPVEGSKIEKVNRVALLVEVRLTRSVSRCRPGGQPSLP